MIKMTQAHVINHDNKLRRRADSEKLSYVLQNAVIGIREAGNMQSFEGQALMDEVLFNLCCYEQQAEGLEWSEL